jgi:hypothetical protein
MSQLEVDKIIPQSGTTLTIGDSGDTVNFADGTNLSIDTNTLYIDSTNNRVGIANASPSTTLDVLGDATIAGNINLGDNNKLILGTGNDLEIFHNGTNSIIENKTGDLILRTPDAESIFLRDAGGNNLAQFNDNSGVNLYHNASVKLATTSTGVDVTGDLTVDTNTLYVDSSNNRVGIGASSPQVPLSVVGLDTQIQFGEVANAGGYLMSEADGQFRISGGAGFKVGGTGWIAKSTEAAIIGHDSGGDIKFFNNTSLTVGNSFTPSERMRIASDGNVYIATTTEASDDVGHALLANGRAYHTADGTYVGLFNRKTSDGEIVQFRKDNTVIGSINARSSFTVLEVGSLGTGISGTSSHTILPSVNNARSDNTNDLGNTVYRWKDIYLSGGLYVGGTGSANKLDDYEEGTWTPVFSSGTGGFNGTGLSVATSAYRKIGNQVHLYASITITSGSSLSVGDSLQFTGQPFTPISPYTYRMGVATTNQSVGSNAMAVGIIGATSTNPGSMRLVITQVNGSVQTSAQTHFNIHYPTS